MRLDRRNSCQAMLRYRHAPSSVPLNRAYPRSPGQPRSPLSHRLVVQYLCSYSRPRSMTTSTGFYMSTVAPYLCGGHRQLQGSDRTHALSLATQPLAPSRSCGSMSCTSRARLGSVLAQECNHNLVRRYCVGDHGHPEAASIYRHNHGNEHGHVGSLGMVAMYPIMVSSSFIFRIIVRTSVSIELNAVVGHVRIRLLAQVLAGVT